MKYASTSIRRRVFNTALLLAVMVTPLAANAGTLDDIKARGRIIVGAQAENPNWGFVNSSGEYQGVDPDVARLIGKALNIPVEFVPVTNNNRFAALQTNKVDVLIASVGMLPDRAKSVQFSQPYAPNETIVVAAKDTPIKGFEDLAHVAVGVPRGAIMDTSVTKGAPAGTEILRFDDDAANMQALLSGQVKALGANLFYLVRLNEQRPGEFEKKFTLLTLYQGAASRLGDKEMNAFLNEAISKASASGELAKIYKKWMGLEMPALPDHVEGISSAVE